MDDWANNYIFILAVTLCCMLGHAMIWVRAINWMHGIRSQKAWTDLVRLGLHTILSGVPLAWLIYLFLGNTPVFPWQSWPVPLNWLAWTYLAVTATMGLVLFPWLWFSYLQRKPPGALVKSESQVHEVGRALGQLPRGKGRRAWMAHLPFNQAYEVEFTEKELVLPRLPAAWDGLRILHISDLHFWGRPARNYFERVFHLCSSRPCDVLALTGDLVDSDQHYDWLRLLKMLKPTEFTLAIRGNHDARYDYRKINDVLHEMGYHVLGGKSQIIPLRGEPLLVAGNEMPWLESLPELSAHEAFTGFRLALIHSPDQFAWTVRERFDLALAGHNHGGQIRMPGFGSIFVPGKTGRRYDLGLHQQGTTLLHVSRGVSGGHPVRYFCRPEVTWLTLRTGNAT